MILDVIADHARERVANDRKNVTLQEIKKQAHEKQNDKFRFIEALKNDKPSLICEVKKASPSKGIISDDFPYIDIAKAYEKGGADCLSVLTEPKWFLGSDDIFIKIRNSVSIPMLRKDFTVDEYQIYQAMVMGADCVLLIVALLSEQQIKEYLAICETLGVNALVEAHDEQEIATAISAGADIIGVNNRNLKDFSVNLGNAAELKQHIPGDVIFVAESGITTPEDGIGLIKGGADTLLIGEALMRSNNKASFIGSIKDYCYV